MTAIDKYKKRVLEIIKAKEDKIIEANDIIRKENKEDFLCISGIRCKPLISDEEI